jgi:DNA-binding MarR family transcriptional regulator
MAIGSSKASKRAAAGRASDVKRIEPAASQSRVDHGLDESVLLDTVGYCVRYADLVLNQWYDHYIRRTTHLRQIEFAILNLLGSNENVTHKQLSQALWISPPNLAVAIDRMEERGLVARRRNPDDGRSQHVALTKKGVNHLRKVRDSVAALEAGLRQSWTQPELRTLLKLLAKLRDTHPVAPPSADAPRQSRDDAAKR